MHDQQVKNCILSFVWGKAAYIRVMQAFHLTGETRMWTLTSRSANHS